MEVKVEVKVEVVRGITPYAITSDHHGVRGGNKSLPFGRSTIVRRDRLAGPSAIAHGVDRQMAGRLRFRLFIISPNSQSCFKVSPENTCRTFFLSTYYYFNSFHILE